MAFVHCAWRARALFAVTVCTTLVSATGRQPPRQLQQPPAPTPGTTRAVVPTADGLVYGSTAPGDKTPAVRFGYALAGGSGAAMGPVRITAAGGTAAGGTVTVVTALGGTRLSSIQNIEESDGLRVTQLKGAAGKYSKDAYTSIVAADGVLYYIASKDGGFTRFEVRAVPLPPALVPPHQAHTGGGGGGTTPPNSTEGDHLVCDLSGLNPSGGSSLPVGALALVQKRLYFVAAPAYGCCAVIWSCRTDGGDKQAPVAARNVTYGTRPTTGRKPGAMLVASPGSNTAAVPLEVVLILAAANAPFIVRVPLADIGSDKQPWKQLVSSSDADGATDLAFHSGHVIWCGRKAVWHVPLDALDAHPASAHDGVRAAAGAPPPPPPSPPPPFTSAVKPAVLADMSGVSSLAIAPGTHKLFLVSSAGVAVCDLTGWPGQGACTPRALLAPWSTRLKWMALHAPTCTLYHNDGKQLGHRQLGSWNASQPVVVDGKPFNYLKQGSPVGPVMCAGKHTELYVAVGGRLSTTSKVYAVGAATANVASSQGSLAAGSQAVSRVLATSEGASPTSHFVTGLAGHPLARALFYVSNRYVDA